MNEQDKEYMRDLMAMFTLCGIVMRGIDDEIIEDVAINAYKMADAMLEAREQKSTVGLPAIKRKRTK
jgi:hypothetical protein